VLVEDPVILEGVEPFACGGHRECYVHPGNRERCLKVLFEDWRECGRRKRASWIARVCRPRWRYDENAFELRFSAQLRRKIGDQGWGLIPQAHRLVKTDKGDALEVDLIRDHDGTISLSLKEYVWNFGETEACRDALEVMWRGLEQYKIFVNDARPDNIVISRRGEGICRCYVIDGYGLPQFIKSPQWFESAKRARFRDRREKQERGLKKLLDQKESGEKIDGKGLQL